MSKFNVFNKSCRSKSVGEFNSRLEAASHNFSPLVDRLRQEYLHSETVLQCVAFLKSLHRFHHLHKFVSTTTLCNIRDKKTIKKRNIKFF